MIFLDLLFWGMVLLSIACLLELFNNSKMFPMTDSRDLFRARSDLADE